MKVEIRCWQGADRDLVLAFVFDRRAYDALNVLTAVDIIAKDKKDIQWKGFPPMVSFSWHLPMCFSDNNVCNYREPTELRND